MSDRRDLFTVTRCNHCNKKIVYDHEKDGGGIFTMLNKHIEKDLDCRIIRCKNGLLKTNTENV
jgi:hypothetical protein